ncbi:MAG: sugar ABC transporter ATP-binding protein, partial [Clostridiales bacterium]|nr:sugar ABC transporter ATP-binding protein [Clostridiales bacterium]
QRQRVALGRAIVRNPKVFLMDEPLSNLDAKLRVQMRLEITKLHQKLQTTFIYVTHDQTEAMTMGDRIVVMKDGFVQQVDSPTALYDKPSNMFVAGFIGSPQMNFYNVMVEKSGADVFLSFGKNKIKLPADKAKKLEGTDYFGKEVIMGIRPESLHDEDEFLQKFPDSTVDAKVEVVEMLGFETLLHMFIEDISCTARVNTRTKSRSGDFIKIAIDTNKLHLFDKETEKAILN